MARSRRCTRRLHRALDDEIERRERRDHLVKHGDPDRRLVLLSGECAGAESGTDQVLVSADRSLGVVASAVFGRSLPVDAAPLAHEVNVGIASGLQVPIIGARHRGRTRRDDDVRQWIVLTVYDGSVDRTTVINAVCRHAGDRQSRDHAGQGRVVGHGQIEPEQAQHAAAERLDLSQGKVEHQTQNEHQLDR